MSDDLCHLFGKFGIGHLLSRLSFEKHDGVSALELILFFASSALWVRASTACASIRYMTFQIMIKTVGLQQFGVIPFEIRSLKIGHTEQRRTQRFYIAVSVRHRGTVGSWRNRGDLRVLLMFLSISLQSSGLQDFLKRLFVYYQSYRQHVNYGSVALCAFGTSVILSAFTSVFSPSLCDLLYVVGLLYHSIFRKNP